MRYRLRVLDEFGRVRDLAVQTCDGCFALVDLSEGSMIEHLRRCDPLPPPPEPRHALRDPHPG